MQMQRERLCVRVCVCNKERRREKKKMFPDDLKGEGERGKRRRKIIPSSIILKWYIGSKGA